MKTNFAIIHVPHAATAIPKKYLSSYDSSKLSKEFLLMTDHYCDELFHIGFPMIKAKVSRLFCDMERFRDDHIESMAAKGMGAIYTHCSDGSRLRIVLPNEKEKILKKYYDAHHKRLTKKVDEVLEQTNQCLIIDGHSFHPTPLPHEPNQEYHRPDFCIGSDPFHTPTEIVAICKNFLTGAGFTVKENNPFSGTIVPLKHYQKDPRVISIMIEVNRNQYMNEFGEKTEHFTKIKATLAELCKKITDYTK